MTTSRSARGCDGGEVPRRAPVPSDREASGAAFPLDRQTPRKAAGPAAARFQ